MSPYQILGSVIVGVSLTLVILVAVLTIVSFIWADHKRGDHGMLRDMLIMFGIIAIPLFGIALVKWG
jgi:hypothetical protein